VALFNGGTTPASIGVSWTMLGLPSGMASVREIWAQQDLGDFGDVHG
jgi:hypothetical protein